MKTTERADGSLQIVNDDRRLGRWFLGGFLACLGLAAYYFIQGPENGEPLIGSIGGAAVFLVAFLALFERSVFIFDRRQCRIDWRRGRPFSRARGSIAFDDVVAVFAESSADSDDNLTRRIVLDTGAELIPLTTAYSGDPDGECVRVAAKIGMLLGHAVTDVITDSVLGLIKTGREIDAIRMVRADRGISLTEAKDVVAGLRQEISG